MTSPLVSVVFPARNEADRLPATIRSIADTRSKSFPLEIVIVDDASTDGCCSDLVYQSAQIAAPELSVRVFRVNERVGVPRARNQGAAIAGGDILFITDAHVQFCQGWDRLVLQHLKPNRILAATIADPASAFKGYGCTLVVPFMGTWWNKVKPAGVSPVQIAACPGTVLKRDLFKRLGGYDSGMLLYSAAEPEFSLRAWLSGAEVVSVPPLQVLHRFKPKDERSEFLNGLRPFMIHNSLRFGLLYMSDLSNLQMIRYFALKFPEQVRKAFKLVVQSDVWERRDELRRQLVHNFDWYIQRFGLKDQVGGQIL